MHPNKNCNLPLRKSLESCCSIIAYFLKRVQQQQNNHIIHHHIWESQTIERTLKLSNRIHRTPDYLNKSDASFEKQAAIDAVQRIYGVQVYQLVQATAFLAEILHVQHPTQSRKFLFVLCTILQILPLCPQKM